MSWTLDLYSHLNFQIAPIIHEWTYDAMCHDLLNLDGNKYVHEVNSLSRLFMYSFKVYVLLFNLDTCVGRIVHTDSKQNWWSTWEKTCSLRRSWSCLARVSPCTYRSCKSCAYTYLMGFHMQKVIFLFFWNHKRVRLVNGCMRKRSTSLRRIRLHNSTIQGLITEIVL